MEVSETVDLTSDNETFVRSRHLKGRISEAFKGTTSVHRNLKLHRYSGNPNVLLRTKAYENGTTKTEAKHYIYISEDEDGDSIGMCLNVGLDFFLVWAHTSRKTGHENHIKEDISLITPPESLSSAAGKFCVARPNNHHHRFIQTSQSGSVNEDSISRVGRPLTDSTTIVKGDNVIDYRPIKANDDPGQLNSIKQEICHLSTKSGDGIPNEQLLLSKGKKSSSKRLKKSRTRYRADNGPDGFQTSRRSHDRSAELGDIKQHVLHGRHPSQDLAIMQEVLPINTLATKVKGYRDVGNFVGAREDSPRQIMLDRLQAGVSS